jgi:hypothetical protein
MAPSGAKIVLALAAFLISNEQAGAGSVSVHQASTVLLSEGVRFPPLEERRRAEIANSSHPATETASEQLREIRNRYSFATDVRQVTAIAVVRNLAGGESLRTSAASISDNALSKTFLENSIAAIALPDTTPPALLFFCGGMLALGLLASQRTRGRKKASSLIERVESLNATAEGAQSKRPSSRDFPVAYRDPRADVLVESRDKEIIQ